MKIKNIQLSLIVLFALAIASFSFFAMAEERVATNKNIFLDSDQDGLSDTEEKTYGTNPNNPDTDGDGYSDGAEVQSGYDPLKPSPGDKLVSEVKTTMATDSASAPDPAAKNLTDEVTQKIADLVNTSDPNNQNVTIDQVKAIVDESLNTQVSKDELPVVTKDELIIKKQPVLQGLTETQIAAIKKNDFADYLVGISYVLSSNSPTPITSSSDLNTLSTSVTQDFTAAIAAQNPQALKKVLGNEQKILDQMKSIPVPEDLIDTHIEALRIAKYAQNLDSLLASNQNDPMSGIANYSKAASFMDYATTFADELTTKFNTYGLTYDDSIKNKLSAYGTELPSDELIKSLTQ